MRSYLLLAIFLVVILISFLTYKGIFEEKVQWLSSEFGDIEYPVFMGDTTDYTMHVTFESKGAFIAGRKIHVSIDFIANRKVDKFRKSELVVAFPGALEYPMQKGMKGISETHIKLNFVNGALAYGKKDIVYFMPEFHGKTMKIYHPSGMYTYHLLIDKVPQRDSQFKRTNAFLYLAPLETKLQLENNNLILALTFFAIYLAIAQFVLSISKRGKNESK